MTVLHLTPATRNAAPTGDEPTPIAVLTRHVKNMDLSERARERDAELAMAAVLSADSVLRTSFPDTLNTVIHSMEWTGNAPLPDNQLMASAVTYLGSPDTRRGWWLHYTRRENDVDGELDHVLTLIAPCSCGEYVDQELADEDTLIAMLAELDTEPGAAIDCDYVLRIRTDSYADSRHESFEPPF